MLMHSQVSPPSPVLIVRPREHILREALAVQRIVLLGHKLRLVLRATHNHDYLAYCDHESCMPLIIITM